MTPDDQLTHRLTAEAGTIELAPAQLDAVMRRGARRRNRKRAALGGVMALALAATSVAVLQRGDNSDAPDVIGSAAQATVVPSTLDWTVVEPTTGLGASRALAVLDGVSYSLSTAPGPMSLDDTAFQPHLYRSNDGADWSEVALPDGVRPYALATGDGALYALGTAPAGGDTTGLVLATSTDGAATWSTLSLPDDVAQLEARHPGQILVAPPALAALDATHLVAAVVVTAQPDVESLIPDDVGPIDGWEQTADGVKVFRLEECADPDACLESERVVKDASSPTRSGAESGMQGEVAVQEPKEIASFTWDELGLDPELRDLIGGRPYVYASDDGSTFERVQLPAGSDSGSMVHLLAPADGYRLLVSSPSEAGGSTSVLSSADGRTWTAGPTLSGWVASAGLLAGQPAISMWGEDDGLDVLAEGAPAAAWTPVDLMAAAPEGSTITTVAFGPLGLAALATGFDAEGYVDEPYLLHSADGTAVSAVRLEDHLEQVSAATELAVTADAIFVRVTDQPDGRASTVEPQTVLVGTPR